MVMRSKERTVDVSVPDTAASQLDDLQDLSRSLTGVFRVDLLLNIVLDSCLRICRAQRGAILLYDASSSDVVRTILRSRDPGTEGIDHQLNLLVAGWVYRHKTTYVTDDVLEDQGFSNPPSSIKDIGPSIGMPLQTVGKLIGIIHLVNPRGGDRFSDEKIRLGTIVASLAAQFIDRANIHEMLFEKNERLKNTLRDEWNIDRIQGKSRAIREVREKIPLLSSTASTILLTGETGTGKDLVSRVIHYTGPRADRPFVAVNCAAIPATLFESELFGHEKGAFTGATQAQRGKFELANGGTLFLDEISEMPLELQGKLLRAIENRRYFRLGSDKEVAVDVRIIAASSKDLAEQVNSGQFLSPLYHRLNVLPVHLPSLRDRKDDIPLLAESILKELSGGRMTFDEGALRFLTDRKWIGNIRELRNVVERASIFIRKSSVNTDDLAAILVGEERDGDAGSGSTPGGMPPLAGGRGNILEEHEKQLIETAVKQANGNVAEAARLLGIDRLALRRRIEKFGLSL